MATAARHASRGLSAAAGPSRPTASRHLVLGSRHHLQPSSQQTYAAFSVAASSRRTRESASSSGLPPATCSCGRSAHHGAPAAAGHAGQIARYSTRPSQSGRAGERALMTSAKRDAPTSSSPANAPGTEPFQPSSSPSDFGAWGSFKSPSSSKAQSTSAPQSSLPKQDSIEVEEDTGACSTLSPSSPSAPRSQKSPAETAAAAEAPAAAAATQVPAGTPAKSSAARRGGGAAFRPKKAALTLTAEAVSRLRDLSKAPGGPKLIRIGVRNKGCAGMSYHLEYVSPEQAGKFDEKVEQDGVKVLIDSKALFSIIGSEMDWKDDKLSSKFIFNNPNVKEACGCGESFLT